MLLPSSGPSGTSPLRSRRVDQNFIKILREKLLQPAWLLAGHQYIADPEDLDILEKPLCPGAADIICNKKTFASKSCPPVP